MGVTRQAPKKPEWNAALDESVRWEAKRSAAPLVTQDAVLALLAETRETSRWIRWTFWAVIAGLAISSATLFVVLFA